MTKNNEKKKKKKKKKKTPHTIKVTIFFVCVFSELNKKKHQYKTFLNILNIPKYISLMFHLPWKCHDLNK